MVLTFAAGVCDATAGSLVGGGAGVEGTSSQPENVTIKKLNRIGKDCRTDRGLKEQAEDQ